MAAPESHYDYFIARGRSRKAVEDYLAAVEQHREAFWALAQELGACEIFVCGQQAYGFGFEKEATIPAALRAKRVGSSTVYVPKLRTVEGKRIALQIEALPKCPPSLASQLFPRSVLDPTGQCIITGYKPGKGFIGEGVGIERVEGELILKVPVPLERDYAPEPPDAEPLQRSAYWRMRESEHARKIAARAPQVSS